MIKKSVLVKTLTAVCATTFLVSAITYSVVRIDEPKTIDFSAFKNATANIEHITSPRENRPATATADVTKSIVNTIEKEVKRKILRTRFALKPKTIIAPAVIAKNWNDIKPEFATVDMKLSAARLNALVSTNNANVSEFEINNKELIKLYGFEVDSLHYESFANTQIASIEVPASVEDIVKEDIVQVAQASTTTQLVDEVTPVAPSVEAAEAKEEIARAEVATKENPINDDLVVYDYSSNKEKIAEPKMKKIFDAPISETVKEAISREVGKSSTVAMNMNTQRKVTRPAIENKDENKDELDKAMADEDNLVFDYSQQSASAVAKKETAASSISAFTAGAKDTTTQAEFIIKAKEINLNTRKVRPVVGYEFVPDYDRAERTDDSASGEIKLGYSLSGDVDTQTGVIQAQGLIPTRVELNLMNNGIEIPMFNEEGIQKFLEKKKTDVQGNLLMVAIDPTILDVEIDSPSQFKVYLSEKFKLLESQDNAAYVLFLGVKTGNISLRYLLSNKESAQKIIYIGDGEMFYEDADFINSEREMYTFTTRSLLGRKVKELNIDGADISFFGSKNIAKKKALNAYEIKVPELVDNSRKYLEFKHLGSSLFVGTSSTTDIEIPGKDFIGKVLEANELSELGERCMVQINLTKDLRDIKANGKNKQGEMFVETTFLDNDGNFSRDNSELSEKVFLSGDMEGIFSVRLDYTDGSTDFLKTFCSEGSYMVEQL